METVRARLVAVERKSLTRASLNTSGRIGTNESLSTSGSLALYGSENTKGSDRGGTRRGTGYTRPRGRGNMRTSEQIRKDGAKCTYCGLTWHYAFECRLRIQHEG